MPVPHIFQPNEVASAHKVNENFEHIMSLIGQNSKNGQWKFDGLFTFGPGYRGVLGTTVSTHAHLTWNAEQKSDGKFSRIASNQPATVLRIGNNGAAVRLTATKSGDLNAQLTEAWAIRSTDKNHYMFLRPNFHIQSVDTATPTLQQYRLTYVPLVEPITLYENSYLGAGSRTWNLYERGIPKDAIGVTVQLYITATTYSGAALVISQDRQKKHRKYGVAANAYGGNAAMYGRTSAQGFVPLGVGAYAGRVFEERTAALSEASCWIQGYWV